MLFVYFRQFSKWRRSGPCGFRIKMADRRENAFPLCLLKRDPDLERLKLRYKKKTTEGAEKITRNVSSETISVIKKTGVRRTSIKSQLSKDVSTNSEFKLPTLGNKTLIFFIILIKFSIYLAQEKLCMHQLKDIFVNKKAFRNEINHNFPKVQPVTGFKCSICVVKMSTTKKEVSKQRTIFKVLSLCHKLRFSHHYIFAFKCRPQIFQISISQFEILKGYTTMLKGQIIDIWI